MRCRKCRRPALFRSKMKKGNARLHGDKEHDLCQRCYRDLQNSLRNRRRRADVGTAVAPKKIGPFPPLRELLAAQFLVRLERAGKHWRGVDWRTELGREPELSQSNAAPNQEK